MTSPVHRDDDEGQDGSEGAEVVVEPQQTTSKLAVERVKIAHVGDLRRHADETAQQVEDGQTDDQKVLSVHAQPEVEDIADDKVADDPHDHEEADEDHSRDQVSGDTVVDFCQFGQIFRRVVVEMTHDDGKYSIC